MVLLRIWTRSVREKKTTEPKWFSDIFSQFPLFGGGGGGGEESTINWMICQNLRRVARANFPALLLIALAESQGGEQAICKLNH